MSRELVETLADALDNDDYETARATLADEVSYELKGQTLHDPDEIVASYRSSSEMARQLFDAVEYDHRTTDEGSGVFIIDYRDILTIDDETLIHNARQRVTVSDGRVTEIVNVEVAGEAEKVDEFLARHGRSR